MPGPDVTSSDKAGLSPREREVLNAIVVGYIQTGQPIGSRTLAKSNAEGLCPASIRTIMADLEEAGYISHPHASAGRHPTDLGYRHYLDSLDRRPILSAEERATLADNLYASGGLSSLLSRCTQLLAAASQQVSVGSALDLSSTVFRHVELVKLSEERLLVVFVSAAGVVTQHVLPVQVPESPADLARHAQYLNEKLAGRTLPEVRDRLAELMAEERARYDALCRRALELGLRYFSEAGGEGEIVINGTERILERPDPPDFDTMKGLLATLEDKRRLLAILNRCLATDGVTTAIGAENRVAGLDGCSVVAASYGYGDRKVGTLGIIGPTRMQYDRAMALVEYVAELLGTAMAASRS